MTIFTLVQVGYALIQSWTYSVIPVAQNPAKLIPFTHDFGPSPKYILWWTLLKTNSMMGDLTLTQAIEYQAGLSTALGLNNLPVQALQKTQLILISLLVQFVMFLGTAVVLLWSAHSMALMCNPTLTKISVSLVL